MMIEFPFLIIYPDLSLCRQVEQNLSPYFSVNENNFVHRNLVIYPISEKYEKALVKIKMFKAERTHLCLIKKNVMLRLEIFVLSSFTLYLRNYRAETIKYSGLE